MPCALFPHKITLITCLEKQPQQLMTKVGCTPPILPHVLLYIESQVYTTENETTF